MPALAALVQFEIWEGLRPKGQVEHAQRWYSFARINCSVRMSPAMAARVTDRLWDIGDIVKLTADWEAQV